MRLAETEYPPEKGDETRPPVIVVHGLFGSSKNWRAHGKRLGPGRRKIVVDLRNHGDSGWDDLHDYPAMAADLALVVEKWGGRAAILGHSMGGKAAMALAQTRPELVERLLVADIAPVTYTHDLLAEIAAMRAVDLTGLSRRNEVVEALTPALGPAVAAFLGQSAILGDAPGWTLNLDALEANMPAIIGYPDLDGVYDGPTFFLHGGASDYVTPAHRPLIEAMFPRARFDALEGAGHWLHADAPRPFLDAANRFLSD